MKIEIFSLIHNWHPFCFQKCSLSLKKREKFFLTPLEKSKNFKNSKIFNNIGSHDGLGKKFTKIGQNAANPTFFFIHPVYIPKSCSLQFMDSLSLFKLIWVGKKNNWMKLLDQLDISDFLVGGLYVMDRWKWHISNTFIPVEKFKESRRIPTDFLWAR